MGNNSSCYYNEGEIPECLICYETFDEKIHTMCFRCKIYLHHDCAQRYLEPIGYCICPHCKQKFTSHSTMVRHIRDDCSVAKENKLNKIMCKTFSFCSMNKSLLFAYSTHIY